MRILARMKTRLAALLSLLLLSACAGLAGLSDKPELSLIDVRSLPSGNLEQRFELTFRLHNPNRVPLPLQGLAYEVDLAGTRFITGASRQDLDVPAYGSREIRLEASTNVLRIGRVLMEVMRDRDEIDYELTARLDTGLSLRRSLTVRRADVIRLDALRDFLEGRRY